MIRKIFAINSVLGLKESDYIDECSIRHHVLYMYDSITQYVKLLPHKHVYGCDMNYKGKVRHTLKYLL